tara:strand:- start:664 stop:1011 length:348 start_codon:yes stop_codon:yes gene_type:complete
MAIIDTLHQARFAEEFKKIRKDNFTWDGLKALYEYLNDLSDDTGEDIEFCPGSFCCEFGEYNLEEFNEDYKLLSEEYKTIDELQENEERVIARFTCRDCTTGEWIEEEKVLVHHG